MNLPNQLTLIRFVLTAVFLATLFCNLPSLALALFLIASLTDYWDGKLARRHGLITNFGVLMDPLADKILMCSAFIVFVELREIASWMVVIIVARELAITGLRLLAASKQVTLAAERYGKHKTLSQITAITLILLSLSYKNWGPHAAGFFDFWVPPLKTVAIWVSVLLTLVSGGIYLWRNRELYLDDV